ncbi:MAG: acyl-CoA thioesterase [Oscillospiraceae bacterium]|nr:acyl-CoA thioesterase [Oscillospiraceae bacterium]
MFERRINYYETDCMGIVHHSNYIRFMEEARVLALDNIGLPYRKVEEANLAIPVTGVKCEYKTPAKFDDVILIDVKIAEYNGVRMKMEYTTTNKESGHIVSIGETSHCFTDSNLKPISLKKINPEMHAIFENLKNKNI